jgi:hypothetical protein
MDQMNQINPIYVEQPPPGTIAVQPTSFNFTAGATNLYNKGNDRRKSINGHTYIIIFAIIFLIIAFVGALVLSGTQTGCIETAGCGSLIRSSTGGEVDGEINPTSEVIAEFLIIFFLVLGVGMAAYAWTMSRVTSKLIDDYPAAALVINGKKESKGEIDEARKGEFDKDLSELNPNNLTPTEQAYINKLSNSYVVKTNTGIDSLANKVVKTGKEYKKFASEAAKAFYVPKEEKEEKEEKVKRERKVKREKSEESDSSEDINKIIEENDLRRTKAKIEKILGRGVKDKKEEKKLERELAKINLLLSDTSSGSESK